MLRGMNTLPTLIMTLFLRAPEAQDFTAEIKLPAIGAVKPAFDFTVPSVIVKRMSAHSKENAGFFD